MGKGQRDALDIGRKRGSVQPEHRGKVPPRPGGTVSRPANGPAAAENGLCNGSRPTDCAALSGAGQPDSRHAGNRRARTPGPARACARGGRRGSLRARGEDARDAIAEVAAETGVAIANDNACDQLVLSGAVSALDDAEAKLQERGVRGKRLPVAGAFHSPLMEPAVEPLRAVVEAVEICEPRVPVLSCVTAGAFSDVGGAPLPPPSGPGGR